MKSLKRKTKVSRFPFKQGKASVVFVILLLFLAIPVTVLLSQQQQIWQQHAQTVSPPWDPFNKGCPRVGGACHLCPNGKPSQYDFTVCSCVCAPSNPTITPNLSPTPSNCQPTVGGMCPMGNQWNYTLCRCAPPNVTVPQASTTPMPPSCAGGTCLLNGTTPSPTQNIPPLTPPSSIKCGSQGLGACIQDNIQCPVGYTSKYRNDHSHACFAQLHQRGYQCCYPNSTTLGIQATQQQTISTTPSCNPPKLFGLGLGWFIPGGNCNQ